MAYQNAQASVRGDINTFLMQAAGADDLFIGDKVFPVYNSDVKKGQYLRIRLGLGELLNPDAAIRTPGAQYARTNRVLETATFDTREIGLEEIVDDSYSNDVSRFLDLEVAIAKILMRSVRISYEVEVEAALMNATTFTATGAAVAMTEGNLATINLPADVAAAKLRLLKKGSIPNAVIMSANVYERVRRSTLMQNQIFGVVPKSAGQYLLPGEQDMARALGVDTLYVGKAPKNTVKKGLTYTGGLVWGDTYVAVANIAGGEFSAGGVGRSIVWTKDSQLFTAETYRDESRRSDVLRVRQSAVAAVVDETCCELITTSYS